MPVRNKFKQNPSAGVFPLRHPSAMSFGLPEHNPQPSTVRGKRRSANTEEYQKNVLTRKHQAGQHDPSPMTVRGPTKIPQGSDHKEYIPKNPRFVRARPH